MPEPVQLRPTRFVDDELPEFIVEYEIKGRLRLRARCAADAYNGSLLYTKEQLGRQGELEMDEPISREEFEAREKKRALARSGILAELPMEA